jgi:putative OPT family oligopeptide transporter
MPANLTSSPDSRAELTVRGIIVGILITFLFTAANVFFGLKAGLTFATSIPAAVISMAVLRKFKGVSIQENNIVQTVASAAGTLSSIIFVLPGLIMTGWWTGFPYWISFSVCALGGILGVMYSIPLRRALVTHSDLPYPEGVACAEVLKVGARGDDGATAAGSGLLTLIAGSLVSAGYYVVTQTQLFASDVVRYVRVGNTDATGGMATGFDLGLSFALFGVGHLVGLWVGMSMLVGVIAAWGIAVPTLTAMHPQPGAVAEVAMSVWRHQVRFIGAGMIGTAAIWSLAKLARPLTQGLASALAASKVRREGHSATLPRTERDLPIRLVGLVILASLLPIGALLWNFADTAGLGRHAVVLAAGGVLYIVLIGFFVAAVCGYMAGLIGASNSPVSGIGILVVLGASLLLLTLRPLMAATAGPALVAAALFITALVFSVATIANDNLQDLKTGQLVDSTPWKQQVALIIGVLAGSAVIPPILDLLNHAYGFAGAPGTDAARALPAPQAALISSLARGVIEGKLDWILLGIGVLFGIALIIVDELLGLFSKQARLPPLAAGLGIYLPMSTGLTIVVGAVVGWLYDRRAERGPHAATAKQLGVLLASGLIVGESLVGVVIAALVVFSGKDAPLALVGSGFAGAAEWIGGFAFFAAVLFLYRWLERLWTNEA